MIHTWALPPKIFHLPASLSLIEIFAEGHTLVYLKFQFSKKSYPVTFIFLKLKVLFFVSLKERKLILTPN